jgi:hypothetical protein
MTYAVKGDQPLLPLDRPLHRRLVLDTGAASRGSGNANRNKEKAVRQWFVEQDLIEGVVYLPENLFYNTSAPGMLLFLNRNKPKDRRGKLFLVNASQVVEKGDPKNFAHRPRNAPEFYGGNIPSLQTGDATDESDVTPKRSMNEVSPSAECSPAGRS